MLKIYKSSVKDIVIKKHDSVSVAKKATWRTMCYLQKPVSTFSAYCSLKTIRAMSTKFVYNV